MRLTLRTLLAYIDDTLDPIQAREIGRKVAESVVAQELIDRIKTVTRRRGLTVPPASGPDKTDANTVAEYLDNDLSPELIAEVEETALNSDVHLAEIAACHQILTLVVGEPASVPPVARQRMYQLVQGPESDPSRRAKRIDPRDRDEIESAAENQAAQRGAAFRLLGAGALGVALGIAIWQILTNLPHRGGALPGDLPAPAVAENSKPNGDNPPSDPPKPDVKPVDPPKPPDEQPKPDAKPEPPKTPIDQLPNRKPSDERKEFGTLASNDAVLLTRAADGPWTRIAPEAKVATAGMLLTLPGYHSELKLDSGATLSCWGNLPDWLPGGLLECQVTLHAPPAGYDLDLTVDRGRIYLTGAKKPLSVRLRFANEIWDLKLADESTEILFEVSSIYMGQPFQRDGKGESPVVQAQLGVITGKVTAQVDARKFELTAPPGPSGLAWENKKAGLVAIEHMSLPTAWAKQSPRPPSRDRQNEIETALRNLQSRINTPNKPVELAIGEMAEGGSRMGRVLALLSSNALGSWAPVLDALENAQDQDLRQAAIGALQSLIARKSELDGQVNEELQGKLGYSDRQADDAMLLLHGFPPAAKDDPGTYDSLFVLLRNERIGLRELAAWRLLQLDPELANRGRFNGGDEQQQRERTITEWRKRIPEGKLPPGRG